ncbi:MAG: AhpC/TSA family protein [Marinilabiliaceae bacterium]|nr:AhpC/TSA family protein [Marinilabiliaceae bacterium]
MKNILFLLALLIFSVSCQKGKYFRVNGTLKNASGKTIYLEQIDLNNSKIIDSLVLTDKGKFSFKGIRLTEPTFFKLKFDENNYLSLLIDSCATIDLEVDAENLTEYSVKNSLENNQIKVLNRKLRTTRQLLDSLNAKYKKHDVTNISERQFLQEKYLNTIDNYKKFVGSFVMDNPRSFTSYYALFQKLDNNTYIMNVMDRKDQVYFATIATSLNILYPESERVKHLYKYVLSAKATQRNLAKTQKIMEMAKSGVPDIEEKTPDGTVVKLSSLKGKLVLLSFWASWNKNSRKENKNLVNVYQKFKHKGFEIYQVSLDQSKILWEMAIEEDGCKWINVSDLRFTESYPAAIYNVKNIPSNYLINHEGEIIGKDLFGYRLEDKLNELLN